MASDETRQPFRTAYDDGRRHPTSTKADRGNSQADGRDWHIARNVYGHARSRLSSSLHEHARLRFLLVGYDRAGGSFASCRRYSPGYNRAARSLTAVLITVFDRRILKAG